MKQWESVLMISMVKKIQKLTNKKVQLILTNKPKLIYYYFDEIVVGNATPVWYVSLKIIIIFFLQFLFQGLRGLYVGFYPAVLGSAVS